MEQKTEPILADYSEFLKENLTSQDIAAMSIELECSISTIYNYLNDKAPNKFLSKAMMDEGLKIVSEKGINIPTIQS